jgi:stage II sporulation protein D
MRALSRVVAAVIVLASGGAASNATRAASPPTIDVHVLSKEHPTELILDGLRHIRVALIGADLMIDGVNASGHYTVPSGKWQVRVPRQPARTYDGEITLATVDRELAVVVRMDRERYVALAVAGESAPGTPPAALEAQAIVARSWAAAAGRRHPDADVCDLAHCQVIRGAVSRPHLAAAQRAAMATRGLVMELSSGEVAMTPFHAACGGRTADPQEIFGGHNKTGAASVEDPGCDGPRWNAQLSRDTVERAAAEAFFGGGRASETKRLVRFADLETRLGAGGWVRTIVDTATGATAFGDAFVRSLGRAAGWNVIRGDRFRMFQDESGGVAIEGWGLGHGVGLCQHGAARRAANGESAVQILGHYFPLTTLKAESAPTAVATN